MSRVQAEQQLERTVSRERLEQKCEGTVSRERQCQGSKQSSSGREHY